MTGKIARSYSPERGFGTIRSDSGGDVLFHDARQAHLRRNDPVVFDVRWSGGGRVAEHLRLARPTPGSASQTERRSRPHRHARLATYQLAFT